jgi:putative sigma-54 modulation protein
VGVAEAADMISAIGGALERIERQALKNKGRWRNLKRQPKEKGWNEESQPETMQMAVGATAKTAVAVAVHSFPHVSHTTQAHITKSQDALALRPMRLEEAIKECEFRDRDVFIFRDPKNQLKVLHRKRDGKLELIEVP